GSDAEGELDRTIVTTTTTAGEDAAAAAAASETNARGPSRAGEDKAAVHPEGITAVDGPNADCQGGGDAGEENGEEKAANGSPDTRGPAGPGAAAAAGRVAAADVATEGGVADPSHGAADADVPVAVSEEREEDGEQASIEATRLVDESGDHDGEDIGAAAAAAAAAAAEAKGVAEGAEAVPGVVAHSDEGGSGEEEPREEEEGEKRSFSDSVGGDQEPPPAAVVEDTGLHTVDAVGDKLPREALSEAFDVSEEDAGASGETISAGHSLNRNGEEEREGNGSAELERATSTQDLSADPEQAATDGRRALGVGAAAAAAAAAAADAATAAVADAAADVADSAAAVAAALRAGVRGEGRGGGEADVGNDVAAEASSTGASESGRIETDAKLPKSNTSPPRGKDATTVLEPPSIVGGSTTAPPNTPPEIEEDAGSDGTETAAARAAERVARGGGEDPPRKRSAFRSPEPLLQAESDPVAELTGKLAGSGGAFALPPMPSINAVAPAASPNRSSPMDKGRAARTPLEEKRDAEEEEDLAGWEAWWGETVTAARDLAMRWARVAGERGALLAEELFQLGKARAVKTWHDTVEPQAEHARRRLEQAAEFCLAKVGEHLEDPMLAEAL
ncbi:unnamed protein product, partial [Scytosiphon promiscuus]